MAGQDQRILKFLDQNRDLTPTITDMMTKLNISISEISDSLIALEAAGLVTKRSNAHGIECWSPSTVQLDARPDASPGQGYSPRAAVPPTAPVPKSAPVPVRHIQPVDQTASQTQTFKAIPSAASSIKMAKQTSGTQQGVGILAFTLGLIAVTGFSTWLAFQLATNEIHKVSREVVDQKGLKATTASLQDFQIKTKAHIAGLEEQVKQLREQMNASHVAVESLKVAKAEIAASALPKKIVPSPRALSKPEKQEKKSIVQKPIAKNEAPATKAKAVKKSQLVNKLKPSDKIDKADKMGKVVKVDKAAKPESTRASSPDENTVPAATYNGPSGEVPKPPGIGDQDLPPPPGE